MALRGYNGGGVAVALSDEQTHMRLAIQEARRSRGEEGRIHPYVGAVVVRNGQVLGSACRGDLDPREHAEFSVLEKKLPSETLAACTVYTTLEPCTTRNHPKVTCADRLIERRVGRVVIGMLDPDQRITGKGILKLRRAGIAVDLFPQALMAELEELNREFTRDREKIAARACVNGVAEAGLTAFYPSRDYYPRFRDQAATIDRYVSTAQSTAVLVSINLMTGIPFHDLCLAMERKLTARGGAFSVTISLLDPDRADLMAAIAPVLSKDTQDLSHTIRQSLQALARFKSGLSKRVRSRIDVRVHQAVPFGSAILLDHQLPNGRIQIETKPYKAGYQRSFAFEVMRTEPGGLYDVLAASYDALLSDGRSVDSGEET
jgi:pyrimidine deaminase RibD-like protein